LPAAVQAWPNQVGPLPPDSLARPAAAGHLPVEPGTGSPDLTRRDLSDYDTLSAQRDDDLDRWSRERDRRCDNSASARYVSSEVVGYEDLDANGS
jgi:hypothetical protein